VKTQIWIAVSGYMLVAIVRKRLGLEASLYQILQILRLLRRVFGMQQCWPFCMVAG
jgi:hypothetical protein